MGQDSGEMFDVFLAPPEGILSVLSEPPRPAGFRKARGLVHADGDWHRSVHIWLHNSKVMTVWCVDATTTVLSASAKPRSRLRESQRMWQR